MAKTGITSKDNQSLSTIFDEELVRAGITADQVPLVGIRGIATQAAELMLASAQTAVANNKRNSNILTTESKSQLISQLIQHMQSITFGSPSSIDLYVEIPIDDIIKLGKSVTPNTYELVFSNKNTLKLDGKIFTPEKDNYYLRVTKKNNKYTVRAYYLNSLGVAENIQTQKLYISKNVYHMIFTAKFVQCEKITIDKTFQDSQIDTFILNTKDIIYTFNCGYSKTMNGPYTKINTVAKVTRGVENALEFKYRAANSIQLEYKYYNGGFEAQVGDHLRTVLLCTTGENINFTGIPDIQEKYPKDLSVTYLSTENDGSYKSYGGKKNSDSIDALRREIMKAKGTRGKIDTENDLQTFLMPYDGDSTFKPKLVIQDILHVFNIFTLLKFTQTISTGEIQTFTIPTNSGTINVDLTKLPKKVIDGKNFYAVRSDMPVKSLQTHINEKFELLQSYDGDSFSDEIENTLFYYVTPFLYAIREEDGFIRVYSDSQYSEAYPSYATYESEDDDHITTRFINTTLRVNDYLDDDGKRIFNITAQIRADEPDVILTDDNFEAKLILTDVEGEAFDVIGALKKIETEDPEKNLYEIVFDFECDRNIFNTQTHIKCNKNKQLVSKDINVKQTVKLELYLTPDVSSRRSSKTLVTRYEALVELFRDVTSSLYLQSNILYSGALEIVQAPLISYDFYKIYHNQQVINQELYNINKFINSTVYSPISEYEAEGKTLQELQETTFRVSIKFAKSYGLSKFLAVGNIETTDLKNLQLSPKFFVSKIDEDYDMSLISSIFNEEFSNWDFISEDLHMSLLTAGILSNTEDYLRSLQFRNFGTYPADYHMIKNNGKTEKSTDIPEVVSIKPKYNENLKIYEYDVTYSELK